MKVNQSVSLSRVSPLCEEEGQAFNSLFSLHSHHAGLYFCDYRGPHISEDYFKHVRLDYYRLGQSHNTHSQRRLLEVLEKKAKKKGYHNLLPNLLH